MFILNLRYVAPLEEVDRHMQAHLDWLRQGRDAGAFLGWGRKVPREGGIILAVGGREEVEAVARTDPFVTHGVAEVEVIEMRPSYLAEGLEALDR